jgi:hypothetical protein
LVTTATNLVATVAILAARVATLVATVLFWLLQSEIRPKKRMLNRTV